MKSYTAIVALGVGVIAAIAIYLVFSLSPGGIVPEEYSIFVDPFKDQQDLFVMARVTIQNTGSKPLTNVRANFGYFFSNLLIFFCLCQH